MPNSPAHVTVWWAPVTACHDKMLAILSNEERARAARFLHTEDVQSFVLAHALARVMLSNLVPVNPADWQFTLGEFGKPSPTQHAGLEFSLSHTRGLVACAVAWNHHVGVDVEPLTRNIDCAALATTVLSPTEFSAWQKLPEEAQPRRFFEYWTLKEAYIKACGLGLSLPLDSFSLILQDGRPPRIADEPERWRFRQEQLEHDYLLAVAVKVAPGQHAEFEIRREFGLTVRTHA